MVWYPEEAVSYCPRCDLEIPVDCYWRGRGFIIGAGGREERTPVLFSQCPACGRRFSTGLIGPWWYRALYGWLWRLRYPNRRPAAPVVPDVDDADEPPRRRASGEARNWLG